MTFKLRRRRESVTVVELLEWMRTRKEPWTITSNAVESALRQFIDGPSALTALERNDVEKT